MHDHSQTRQHISTFVRDPWSTSPTASDQGPRCPGPCGSTPRSTRSTQFHFPFANARVGQPSVKLILATKLAPGNCKVPKQAQPELPENRRELNRCSRHTRPGRRQSTPHTKVQAQGQRQPSLQRNAESSAVAAGQSGRSGRKSQSDKHAVTGFQQRKPAEKHEHPVCPYDTTGSRPCGRKHGNSV